MTPKRVLLVMGALFAICLLLPLIPMGLWLAIPTIAAIPWGIREIHHARRFRRFEREIASLIGGHHG